MGTRCSIDADRGDLIILDFEPQAGRQQMKRRPALVLSPAAFKGHAFEIALPAGLRVKGSVMVHQLKSFDWRARRATADGKAPDDVIDRASDVVKEVVS